MTDYGTPIILTFGKYKGHTVRDVAKRDNKYLAWVVLNMEEVPPPILTEIWVYLTIQCSAKFVTMLQRQRSANFSAKRKAQTNYWGEKEQVVEMRFESRTQVAGVSKQSIETMAVKWYRDSAKKWHPDLCRGDNEPMKAVNDCYERLKELISKL